MAWMQALDLAKLQQHQRQRITLSNHDILLIWHKNEAHAIQAKCPHFKLPLTKGKLTDDCAIICPFHKSAFNLKTGDVACWSPWPPVIGNLLGKISREKQLKIYLTRVEDDIIWVDV